VVACSARGTLTVSLDCNGPFGETQMLDQAAHGEPVRDGAFGAIHGELHDSRNVDDPARCVKRRGRGYKSEAMRQRA
jgi:hypothetical protein